MWTSSNGYQWVEVFKQAAWPARAEQVNATHPPAWCFGLACVGFVRAHPDQPSSSLPQAAVVYSNRIVVAGGSCGVSSCLLNDVWVYGSCVNVNCNHGLCQDGQCVCSGGYSGPNCNITDACSMVLCGPFGKCVTVDDMPTCFCQRGYEASCRVGCPCEAVPAGPGGGGADSLPAWVVPTASAVGGALLCGFLLAAGVGRWRSLYGSGRYSQLTEGGALRERLLRSAAAAASMGGHGADASAAAAAAAVRGSAVGGMDEHWLIEAHALVVDPVPIAEGGFSQVFRASYCGAEVAVKQLHGFLTASRDRELLYAERFATEVRSC